MAYNYRWYNIPFFFCFCLVYGRKLDEMVQGHFALSVPLGTKQKVGRYVSFNTDIWVHFYFTGL